MTKDEFIERRKAFDARSHWFSRPLLGTFVVAVLSWDWITERSNELNIPLLAWGVKNAVGLLSVSLIGCVLLTGWSNKRRLRQEGLMCAHCSEVLLDNLAMLAIATGKCGKCGHPAFIEKVGDID